MKQANGFTLTVKCVDDTGYKGSVYKGKTYKGRIFQFGALSVIDESGESYIYPENMFEIMQK